MSDSPLPDTHLLKKPTKFSSPSASPGKSTAFTLSSSHRSYLFAAVLSLQIILLFSAKSFSGSRFHFHRPPPPTTITQEVTTQCQSGLVYVYDLPPIFNKEILDNCDGLNPWNSRCDAMSNGGFGRRATDLANIVPKSLLSSWYATDQFAAEILYHRRMLSHRCRTTDPSSATAFYIPFYAGLAVGKHLWTANSTSGERDKECYMLLDWIKNQTSWTKSSGWDHFIMLGRITWDFRRSKDEDWGGSFLYMDGMENVTRLLIEKNPWDSRDVGVPYPTGFHPKTGKEVRKWQKFVLNRTRSTLFSFAGAARSEFKDDFRGLLLNECSLAGEACKAVNCGGGRCGNRSAETVSLFLDSVFCLQPRGDSFTRRSMFDCMVAGAIPVLFWRRSAYVQYSWYLPEEEWSVFVDRREVRSGKVSLRKVLEGIGEERIQRMRRRVVELIPKLVYGGGEEGIGDGVDDAFDVALDGVLRRFREQRRRREEREERMGGALG